jgi:imidazolonepropionase-like amidohydrolase
LEDDIFRARRRALLARQVCAIIPGAHADLLVVDGDPYSHVSVL